MPGGGPYNTARAIGRLGGDVHFLGRISNDWFGRLLRERLESDGVGTGLVVATSDPTTLVLAEIDAAGVAQYQWYVEKTSVPGLQVDDARRCLTPAPDAIHVGTLGLVLEPIAESLATVVAEAPLETFVMVDPNCRPNATDDPVAYRERMARVLRRADVVKASGEDLDFLRYGGSRVETVQWMLEAGAGAVVVTDGGEATRAWNESGELEVPVPKIEVVDTVGAGDAFGGAFLMRWLEQGLGRHELGDAHQLADAVAYAVRAAAIDCQRAGAEPPTRAEMGIAG